jgi:hypothetical protein
MFLFGKGDKEGSQVSFQRDKIVSAVFYGITSVLVIFTNKWLLTWFHFPYFKFVATAQFFTTSFILAILSSCKKIDIPALNYQIFKEIIPVSLMFLGNVLCGLGSTNALNIPMFTALRRYSILMTMLLEWWLLSQSPPASVWVSVGLMVGGAQVAALYDLAYDTNGYVLVFLNNIFTALNGVYMRKATVSGKCSKMGVLYYNSLFSGIIMAVYFVGEHAYYSSTSQTPGLRAYGMSIVNPRAAATPATPEIAAHRNTRLLSTSKASDNSVDSSQFATFLRSYKAFTSNNGDEDGSSRRQLRNREDAVPDAPALPNPADRKGQRVITQSDVPHTLTETEIADTKARLSKLNNHINQEIHKYSQLQKEGEGKPAPEESVEASGKGAALPVGFKPVKVKEKEGVSTITQVLTFPGWGDWKFVLMLLLCCCMGSVLNYAIFLCTTRNSALTTAVVGTLKNVVTTYIGMVLFSDYAFTWINFVGINISIVGSIYYTLVAMKA